MGGWQRVRSGPRVGRPTHGLCMGHGDGCPQGRCWGLGNGLLGAVPVAPSGEVHRVRGGRAMSIQGSISPSHSAEPWLTGHLLGELHCSHPLSIPWLDETV